MAGPARGWLDRAHALHKRQHPAVRQVTVVTVGGTLVTVGAVLLVLPGPGLLLIAAGVAVLSLEFKWAGRLVRRGRVMAGRFKKPR